MKNSRTYINMHPSLSLDSLIALLRDLILQSVNFTSCKFSELGGAKNVICWDQDHSVLRQPQGLCLTNVCIAQSTSLERELTQEVGNGRRHIRTLRFIRRPPDPNGPPQEYRILQHRSCLGIWHD